MCSLSVTPKREKQGVVFKTILGGETKVGVTGIENRRAQRVNWARFGQLGVVRSPGPTGPVRRR